VRKKNLRRSDCAHEISMLKRCWRWWNGEQTFYRGSEFGSDRCQRTSEYSSMAVHNFKASIVYLGGIQGDDKTWLRG
jgi:hypothetical protein